MAIKKQKRESTNTSEEKEVLALDNTHLPKLEIALKQLEASMTHKKGRMAEIRLNEEAYLGKQRVALRNRFNVPFDSVVMQGALDTILSRSNDAPKLSFIPDEQQYRRSALKVQAAYDKLTGATLGRWKQKDRIGKRMGYLSGRIIFEKYTTSDPEFKDVLENVDHYDFQCEPQGGPNLDEHLFKGRINNFVTKEKLIGMKGKSGYIDQNINYQIALFGKSSDLRKAVTDEFKHRSARYKSLGLEMENADYIGNDMFNLVKWQMSFEGEEWYLLFDPRSKVVVRACLLSEITESELTPWVSWATHEDVMFWSRSYADSLRPQAEVYRVLVNQMLENIQRQNWNHRAYDPSVFPDPSKLDYAPDGKVKANLKPGMTNIDQAIYEFKVPDTVGVTLNAMQWLNAFIGEKVGVGPNEQGNSKDTKVGIYFGNIQQASERFGLLNDSYVQAWVELGMRFDHGLYEHVPEKMMVKIVGLKGVEWDELRKEDVAPEYTVTVVSENAEASNDEMQTQKKEKALTLIANSPILSAQTNPKATTEEILRFGGYTDEAVRRLMDTDNYADQDALDRAAEMIDRIVNDKEWPVPLVRGATTSFQQKIMDFAMEHSDLKQDIFDKLMIYAQAHNNIVTTNMARRALFAPKPALPAPAMTSGKPTPPQAPLLSPTGVAQRGQEQPLTPSV